MKKIRKFRIKLFSKSSGKLIPISFDKQFPTKVKRIFFLYGKKNKTRGEHAHKKCSQFFIPIYGKVILNIKTPNTIKKIMLNHLSKTAVLIPAKYWCGVKFISKNSNRIRKIDHETRFRPSQRHQKHRYGFQRRQRVRCPH